MSDQKIFTIYDNIEVKLDEKLVDDFDFASELIKAKKEGDLAKMVSLYFCLVGGNDVYQKVREKIKKDYGYVSNKEILNVVKKIDENLPKA